MSLLLGEVLTFLLIVQVGLVLWNIRVVRRPPARRWPADAPLISVLVPARDEAANIGACVQALLEQDYPNFEVIVLDDESSDGTAGRAGRDPRVRVIPGAPWPDGFVDADTILSADALSRAAGELHDDRLGLVSMLLRTDTGTVAEVVLMPMVNHALLALLPAALMERPAHPDLAIALGPFLMVRRDAYAAAGGHAAAPEHIVDDVQLARAVKASGHRVGLRNGTEFVHTRWYEGFREIWDGFSKNAYGGLAHRPGVALAALCIVAPAPGQPHPEHARDHLARWQGPDVVHPAASGDDRGVGGRARAVDAAGTHRARDRVEGAEVRHRATAAALLSARSWVRRLRRA